MIELLLVILNITQNLTGNLTQNLTANLTESPILQETVDVVAIPKSVDLSSLIVIGIIGVVCFLFMRYNETVKDFLRFSSPWKEDREFNPRQTDYDNLPFVTLEKIIDRLNRNFTLLISIYGILFAFIVSSNLQKVFVSWSFIIWAGWILAVIIRAGIFALEISDVLETNHFNSYVKKARKVYAAKTFLRHSLYLLVPTLAFLPAIYFPFDSESNIIKPMWTPDLMIISVAFAIISVFVFVYLIAARASDFENNKGIEGFWVYTIMLILFGSISYLSASPLAKESIILFGIHSEIPNVYRVIMSAFGMFGVAIVVAMTVLIFFALYEKIKRKIKS